MNVNINIENVVLHTKRLTLRLFEQKDLNDLYEYAKVEGVGERAGWPHHENIETSQEILDMFISGKKTFAIVFNNKVIGSIGIEMYKEDSLPELDNLKCRELGFVLSKDYWKQGIMSEAASEVIRYLFEEVKLDAIVCGHFISNIASSRLQDKLGFKPIKEVDYTTRYDTVEKTLIRVLYK